MKSTSWALIVSCAAIGPRPAMVQGQATRSVRPFAVYAFIVRRLRDAGAIVIGKSNMHELAAGITTISSLGGQTLNPYDPRRCPGGSSGGTGAAIAASFAAVGWGSDTCGSIRIDAGTRETHTAAFTDSLRADALRGARIGILTS